METDHCAGHRHPYLDAKGCEVGSIDQHRYNSGSIALVSLVMVFCQSAAACRLAATRVCEPARVVLRWAPIRFWAFGPASIQRRGLTAGPTPHDTEPRICLDCLIQGRANILPRRESTKASCAVVGHFECDIASYLKIHINPARIRWKTSLSGWQNHCPDLSPGLRTRARGFSSGSPVGVAEPESRIGIRHTRPDCGQTQRDNQALVFLRPRTLEDCQRNMVSGRSPGPPWGGNAVAASRLQ